MQTAEMNDCEIQFGLTDLTSHPLYEILGSLWLNRDRIHNTIPDDIQANINNAANALLSVALDGLEIDDLTVVLLSMIVVIGDQILKTAETSSAADSEMDKIIFQTALELKSVTDQVMSETCASVESESDFVIEKEDGDDEYERHYYYKPKKSGTKCLRSKRRPNHSKPVIEKLKKWLHSHESHPYPTEHQKSELCSSTGLSMLQLNNWFINARRRLLKG